MQHHINKIMRDSWDQSGVLHLSASLESIRKCIRESKQELLSPTNSYLARSSHSTIAFKGIQSGHINLNISLTLEEFEIKREATSKQKPAIPKIYEERQKSIREKPFGKINGWSDHRGKSAKETEKREEMWGFQQLNGQQEREREFSFGNSDELKGVQKVQPREEEVWIGSINRHYDDAIKIIDDGDSSSQYEDGAYETPKKEATPKQEATTAEAKNGSDILFGGKVYQSRYYYEQKEALTEAKDEGFGDREKELESADAFIKQSLERHRRLQQTQEQERVGTPSTPKDSTRAKKHFQNHRTEADEKEKDNSEKMRLLLYFGKSASRRKRAKEGSICEKFIRQLERDRRQRYLAEALRIPGIDKYFTISEIEELYQSFRLKKQPEYRWSQYLHQKMKSQRRFSILTPREVPRDATQSQ